MSCLRTKRAVSINNSLVHGICNCRCQTCGIHQPGYTGPRAYQSREVVGRLLERIREARSEGLQVRYLANSGEGEPTLHPDFDECMDLFGDFLYRWDEAAGEPPEISVVSNGLAMTSRHLQALVRNRIALKLSFPTADPRGYGYIMVQDPSAGEGLREQFASVADRAMALAAEVRLPSLEFHVSPPHAGMRRGFEGTVAYLVNLAKRHRLPALRLLLFPTIANRTGLVRAGTSRLDGYRDLFRRYHRRRLDGVRIFMALSFKRFFPAWADLWDVARAFDYPCFWQANFFISPFGDSACCNDQSLQETLGDIFRHSLRQIMEMKEARKPSLLCRACNQSPEKILPAPWRWLLAGAKGEGAGGTVSNRRMRHHAGLPR